MLIKFGYDIAFTSPAPTPMVLMLHTHPSRWSSLRKAERLVIEPEVPFEEFFDSYGNKCVRLVAPAGTIRFTNDAIAEDSGLPDVVEPSAPQISIESLPTDTLLYLLPSRYCEVEKLSETAWNLFGHTPPGWARVQAICGWVHGNVTFGYGFARSDKTAYEVFAERKGVCRDFMHLAITFCRCMGIPARYATGYLGDICVPVAPFPMDFSAWFEAFLGGQWYTFDARHNIPRVGRVLMARGRDATDVALTTTFGKHQLGKFIVWTDEASMEAATTQNSAAAEMPSN